MSKITAMVVASGFVKEARSKMVSVCMGLLATTTASLSAIVGCGLAVGLLAGAFNGALVTRWQVPAIVATIGTMSLYRGIAYGILGDRVLKDYPPAFAFFGQGYIAGPVSFELLLFTLAAVLCALYLHRTEFGRRLVAIGCNKELHLPWIRSHPLGAKHFGGVEGEQQGLARG